MSFLQSYQQLYANDSAVVAVLFWSHFITRFGEIGSLIEFNDLE